MSVELKSSHDNPKAFHVNASFSFKFALSSGHIEEWIEAMVTGHRQVPKFFTQEAAKLGPRSEENEADYQALLNKALRGALSAAIRDAFTEELIESSDSDCVISKLSPIKLTLTPKK